MNFIADSVGATEALGESIGLCLRGGEVIELIGDLGAGKTAFVVGLARGLSSEDHVSSPTFTIENVYHGRLTLRHLDLYRLQESGLIAHALEDALADPQSVIAVEWGGVVSSALPLQRIKIQFKTISAGSRSLHMQIPSKFDYIKQALR